MLVIIQLLFFSFSCVSLFARAHTTIIVPTPAALRADLLAAHSAQYKIAERFTRGLKIHSDLIGEISFRPQAIAQTLFNPDLVRLNQWNVIRISGSEAKQRCSRDWFADYFGLKRPVITNFSFEPWVSNAMLTTDIEYRFSCNNLWSIRAFTPIVATWWNLGAVEHNIQSSQCNSSYPAGYFSDLFTPVSQVEQAAQVIGVPCVSLLCTARQFFSEMLAPDLSTPNGTALFVPLEQSRFPRDAKSRVGLADIYATFGKTVVHAKKGHLDLMSAILIPASRYTDTHHLFGPMFGNGGHWGLGAACDAQAYIWQNEAACTWTLASFYASIMHLFDTTSCRTVDLCNGAHSRYMTALQMNKLDQTTGPDLLTFSGLFTPVANLTTVRVKISTAIQANAATLVTFAHHKQRYSFGYDFYARSCEKIDLVDDCLPFDTDNWALKGDAFVYGFIPMDTSPTAAISNTPVPLGVSQSCATIRRGANNTGPQSNVDIFSFNDGVDNPTGAQFGSIILTRQPLQTATPDNQQFRSTPLTLLSRQDLNLNSVRTRGLQQGVLAQWAYLFETPKKTGSIRIGTRIVFGMKTALPNQPHHRCENTSLNTWSIWFGGGIAL